MTYEVDFAAMNSAAKHRKAGKKEDRSRQKPLLPNLIEFLELRGLYQRGKAPLNFRTRASTKVIQYRFPLPYENQIVSY